jgi:hypothetical protein
MPIADVLYLCMALRHRETPSEDDRWTELVKQTHKHTPEGADCRRSLAYGERVTGSESVG